jgi:hypothetical protein
MLRSPRCARWAPVLHAGCLASALGCSARADDDGAPSHAPSAGLEEASIRGLSNGDVVWDGNTFGLHPAIESDAAKAARAQGAAAIPGLLEALDDPDRFVAAHVVLTQVAGVTYSAFPAWNGLAVLLEADGTTEIDPGQRAVLARRWRRWVGESPRQAALPEADRR